MLAVEQLESQTAPPLRSLFPRRRLRFVAVAIPAMLLLLLIVQLATNRGGATAVGPSLGADYPAFHTAGQIIREYPGSRLYDLGLQAQLGDAARPGAPPGGSLLFVHPPATVLPFVPLAGLSYTMSFLMWVAVSLAVVGGGLVALRRACPHLAPTDWSVAAGLAFAAQPLLAESILGGQIAVIAFLALALALTAVRRGHLFCAGLALSLLAYKPTLLLLFVPLVLLGRRWRVVAGLAVGGLAWGVVSLVVAGPEGCRDWVNLMTAYGKVSTGSAADFRLFKFIDLNSALRLSFGDQPWIAGLAAALAVPSLAWLTWAWMRRDQFEEASLWAATATGTLVLNLHVAVYDVALAVPGVLVTLDAMARRTRGELHLSAFDRGVLAAAWCVPWFAQQVAMLLLFHPLTPTLALLAAWQLARARRDQ
jgi:hypothetical protein